MTEEIKEMHCFLDGQGSWGNTNNQKKQLTTNQPTNQNKPTNLLLKKKKKKHYVKAVRVSVPSSYSFDSMGHQIH